jgi:acetyl/propionyl-CoA carboxylase alpha subunit/acetyl-CoA carboxylase carboxyltransferase component
MPPPSTSALREIRCIGIVNRGEAALRCIRTVKAMRERDGIELRCLTLYTDADRDAPFVRQADSALRLQPTGPSAVSAYLDAENLIEALQRGGADAVWPGWGFVAEDAAFADRVAEAGLVFLGPSGAVMRALGDKIGAKQVAEQAGVPVIAWSGGATADVASAREHAARIGYPVVLKASAGGGGRGIRIVESQEELAAAFESARTEARTAFGDERLFVEQRLRRGRHIEVQIAADVHGNAWALGCRDCSVQRRHQKILEEAPPPGMPAAAQRELMDAAVRLAQSVGYVGVGTVEYLVSNDATAFLEVNPRLQVEHGLTEELTGVDLVELQIRIGRGESLAGDAPPSRGAAIEARVCAEDPEADFLPSPGRIARFEPALGPGIRIDTGVGSDSHVPPDFDSLIAKVIAVGDTREEARARLSTALADFELVVEGGASNKGYLLHLIDHERYRRADFDTEWLDSEHGLRSGSTEFSVAALCAAAVLSYQRHRDDARRELLVDPSQLTPSSVPASTGQRIDLAHRGESYELHVYAIGAWRYRVHLDGRVVPIALRCDGPNRGTLETGGRSLRLLFDVGEQGLRVEVDGHPSRFGTGAAGQVRAGTPAMVVSIAVKAGDRVNAGDPLGRLEAMKMELGFEAPISGVVKEIFVGAGEQVNSGALLLAIESDGESAATSSPRLALHREQDPLDLLFRGEDETPDLLRTEAAPTSERHAAMRSVREEIRRVLMGYDVNPERGEKLAAFLETPLPENLSESFRWELAEVRGDLLLFADIEQLFSRAPLPRPSGEAGPSSRAILLDAVRRYREGGGWLPDAFRDILLRALAHYGVEQLTPTDALERALLRLLASQAAPELRRRLVLGCLSRVHALAGSGIHLGDDRSLDEVLARIAGMRGLISDAAADLSIEARYAIFEGPRLESQAERTTKEVESWLAAAEAAVTHPPESVLAHLAGAPRAVFDRVGRWLADPDPRRRAIAVAAHVRRLYAHQRPRAHTSGVVGPVHVERLDLPGDRVVLGSLASPAELAPTLERLGRAASAAAVRAPSRRVDAIELLVPIPESDAAPAVVEAIAPLLGAALAAQRLTLTLLPPEGRPHHLTFEHGFGAGRTSMREDRDLHGIHPETAARIDLGRLRKFEVERLESPEDIYCFHAHSPEIPEDERLFVFADVRGRSPDAQEGHEASLHVAAFERDFFEAARCLRNHLQLRDPRRRLQWNRLMLFASPSVYLERELVESLSRRLYPATRHLGLEKVVVRLNVLDREEPEAPARPVEIVFADPTGSRLELTWREPHHDPLEPAQIYERKVVEARRRRLVYPYEIVRLLTGAPGSVELGGENALPPGQFEEYDLESEGDPPRAVSAAGRPPAQNESAIVFGVIDTPTESVPEGMRRVLILSDPTLGMGSLAAPECDRIVAAIDLAEELELPVEWVPVSSGARIAMDSGTENLDATARVVRRIVTFTEGGGSIHVIVPGVNVGAQSYFDALATMLLHTRGVLIMTPGASMVLTGRAALAASGSVSAEDEVAIGGYERVMGPNGEAQFLARNLAEAYAILYHHYRYAYVVPGEPSPRALATSDPRDRRVVDFVARRALGHDFDRIGEIFDFESNAERKRPFAMRALMNAVIDADLGHLERWRGWQGAETAIVWDACLGGQPISLIGIESRNVDRGGDNPADGPAAWTGGTLFPLSSKKVARALNAASGVRPVVILANLSGFDGSPESMRRLQLEHGAEIARAVVNFRGPIAFLVVSRYHGGAYVVFSRELNDGLRAAAVEGSFASVIGGGPAAAVVFSREARARALRDPRMLELRRTAERRGDGESRAGFDAAYRQILLQKQAELGAEFDAIHTVERALEVGSLESLIPPEEIRPCLIDLVAEETS